jgi:YHS domain-containing protein
MVVVSAKDITTYIPSQSRYKNHRYFFQNSTIKEQFQRQPMALMALI